jgi:hypothetical protein
VKKMKLVKWAEQYRTTLNGRLLSGRPRLFQSCSAIKEEEYTHSTNDVVCRRPEDDLMLG